MELKQHIKKHLWRYIKSKDLDLSQLDIDAELDNVRIVFDAPEDFVGIGTIINQLNDVCAQYFKWGKLLVDCLDISDWFLDAFKFRIEDLTRFEHSQLFKTSKNKGWCSERPFYAFLFELGKYPKHAQMGHLLVSFVQHYLKHCSELNDPNVTTGAKTRAAMACDSARLLFSDQHEDFWQAAQLVIVQHANSSIDIANMLKTNVLPNLKKTANKSYLSALSHFFAGDWPITSPRNSVATTNAFLRARYHGARQVSLDSDESNLLVLLPKLEVALDDEGINSDDRYATEELVIDGDSNYQPRSRLELSGITKALDKRRKRKKQIDITARVRTANNTNLTSNAIIGAIDLGTLITLFSPPISGTKRAQVALCFWVMLLTGWPVAEIEQLIIGDSLESMTKGIFIDAQGAAWWVVPVNRPAKAALDQSERGLSSSVTQLLTPCPSWLTSIISNADIDSFQGLDIPKRLNGKLKKLREQGRLNRSVSLTALTNFMGQFASRGGVIDSGVLDYSFGLSLYTTRVSRSYLHFGDETRLAQLQKFWCAVASYVTEGGQSLANPLFEMRRLPMDQPVGSVFMPSDDKLTELVSVLKHQLDHQQLGSVPSFDDIIQYHNAYVAYVVHFLVYATGYRAVCNPLPSLAFAIEHYGLIAISDKDDEEFSYFRFVVATDGILQQLRFYRTHLHQLAEVIRLFDPALATELDQILLFERKCINQSFKQTLSWYRGIRNSRTVIGPMFYFNVNGNQATVQNMTPKAFGKLSTLEPCLPANAGRHWLKSKMVAKGICPELINWQMGHSQVGQSPMASYSAFSSTEARRALGSTLETMLMEIGWCPIKSMLS